MNDREINLYQQERDAIAFLGLGSFLFQHWDSPNQIWPGINNVAHSTGLNIAALVIDNSDSEVLALERNAIHSLCNPLEHAEVRAIRTALDRLKQKRPKPDHISIEDYYINHLFYREGKHPTDYLTQGCTLVTTLEPCPMCTATICVCRMKRTVFIIDDATFGGSFYGNHGGAQRGIKNNYYSTYDLEYAYLKFDARDGEIISAAQRILNDIRRKVGRSDSDSLRGRHVYDTLVFDHLRDDLFAINNYFQSLDEPSSLASGVTYKSNLRMLIDLKTRCGDVLTSLE